MSTSTRAVYLLPGQSIKVKAPKRLVKTGTHPIMDSSGVLVEKTLKNGFALENEDAGVIEEVKGEPAVIYTHKKYMPNRIFFVGAQNNFGYVDVIGVPIHDHASIISGGPSFGTFYQDGGD